MARIIATLITTFPLLKGIAQPADMCVPHTRRSTMLRAGEHLTLEINVLLGEQGVIVGVLVLVGVGFAAAIAYRQHQQKQKQELDLFPAGPADPASAATFINPGDGDLDLDLDLDQGDQGDPSTKKGKRTNATDKKTVTEAPWGESTRKARATMVFGVGAVEVFDDDVVASVGQLGTFTTETPDNSNAVNSEIDDGEVYSNETPEHADAGLAAHDTSSGSDSMDADWYRQRRVSVPKLYFANTNSDMRPTEYMAMGEMRGIHPDSKHSHGDDELYANAQEPVHHRL